MKSGWVTKKLGEVCEITMGASPDSKSYNTSREGLPFYQGKTEFGIEHPTPVKWCSAPVRIASMGDILLSVRAPIGPVNFANEKCCIGRGLSALRFEGEQRYLYYFLQANESELDARGTGTTFKCISGQSLRQIPIPIPPLAEQKRIVAKIDAAFEKIDALKANAEKNLANAKELFQSALDEAMRPKKGWVVKRLGEVGEYRKGPFGSSLTKRMFVPKGPTTIKVYEQKNAIRKSATLGEYYITREYFNEKMRGFEVLPGDVIVSCAGTIGETFIMPENMEQGIINQALMRMRISALIDKSYFLYYFDHILKKSANELSNGSAMKNIPPFSVFKQLIIPVPTLAEQRDIVKRLDALSSKLETLQQNYAQQIADCAEMRQAILREAFEGRL